MNRFHNKVVIVTGAASGMGEATVRVFPPRAPKSCLLTGMKRN